MALDRFKWWAILFVSSVVLLFSILERVRSGTERVTGIVFTSVSITVSVCGILASIVPQRLLLFRLESVLIWISVIFWGSVATFSNVIPINADTSIEINVIPFPNQFFFGYLCLIASVMLLASWFQKDVQSSDTLSTQFILLSASSFIVMVSAIGFRDRRLDIEVPEVGPAVNVTNVTISNATIIPNTGDPFNFTNPNSDMTNTTVRTSFCEASDMLSCARVEFAIVVGAFSAAIALAVALSSKSCLPVKGVVDVSMILFLVWCCSIAFLTFHNGPGFSLGTIFFASYISLFLCLDILVKSLNHQSTLDRQRDAARADDFRERLTEELRNAEADDGAFVQVSIQDVSDMPSLEMHLGDSNIDSDGFFDAFESLQPTDVKTEEPRTETAPNRDRTSSTTSDSKRGRLESFQDVTSSAPFESRRGRRKSHQRRSRHKRSLRRKNYRSMSGSIFESVGAWRGTSIYNLAGERIPNEVANPSGIQDDKVAVEAHDILRIELWIVLLISSIVCLVAIVQLLPGFDARDPIDDVAIAMPSISIFISAAGVIACGKRDKTSRYVEFLLIVIAIACWIVSMVCRSAIVDLSGRQISTGTVASANIFCASWGCFIVSIALGCAWVEMSLEVADFVFLVVFGTALTASSILFYREEISLEIDDTRIEGEICKIISDFSCIRVRFGIYLGVATSLTSVLVLSLQQRILPKIRLLVGLSLFVAWSCAVGYLTFGRGHGSYAGSVYLEVWASFFLSMDIINGSVVSMLRSYYGEEVEHDEHHHEIAQKVIVQQPQVADHQKEQNATFKQDSSEDSPDEEAPGLEGVGVTFSSSL